MPEERVTTTTVYTYDELDDSAKDRAREIIGTWNAEWEGENLSDWFANYLNEQGFPSDKIEYSLSYSQGDGVAFYGSIDLDKWLTANSRKTYYRTLRNYNPWARIDGNSWSNHYSHAYTMNVTVESDYDYSTNPKVGENQERLLAELCDELEESVRDMSHKLNILGYEAFEYCYSDEAVRENCEANEYQFTEEGEIA